MNVVERLSNDWHESGIEKDDLVLLHANIKNLYLRYRKLGYRLTLDEIIDSFLSAVGDNGGIIFPAFTYEYSLDQPFDMLKTKSGMGSLSEAARIRAQRARTGHPYYSFSCLGNYPSELNGLINIDAFGPGSPFEILHRAGAKIAVLALDDQHSMTFYHYAEQLAGAPYRFSKSFLGTHIDLDGRKVNRVFSMYVRDMAKGIVTDVNPMGELLWTKGLYKGYRFNQGSRLRTIRVNDLVNETMAVVASGDAKGLLYSVRS
ncbi:AAC(3) family N-acetyltransferase [Thalassospira sp.]|uniref:AAC(3) family N-acetyltransferase n=1 Tax=Thalassospira sp. TaxID=1912094 RepID=UPI001B2B4FC6|nr:AAC(3) family N-acetyltransferase [Thalassospira sp.]MBO6805964.1 AAC(3) family N-acetyltransferase [Thalassospira sp.]